VVVKMHRSHNFRKMVTILAMIAMVRPSMAENPLPATPNLEVEEVQLLESELLELPDLDLAATQDKESTQVKSKSNSAVDTAAVLKKDLPVRAVTVRLQEDGLLVGRVRLVYATGKTLPANVDLSFVGTRGDVQATSTGETGSFYVDDLQPGRYVATAALENGSTEFRVNVLPFDEDALPGEMFLDASLSPTPELLPVVDRGVDQPIAVDQSSMVCSECGQTCNFPECGGAICEDCGELVCGECMEEVPCDTCNAPQMACGCGGGGGGCCGGGGGGGGGFGGFLGAAGLAAGITALALSGDDNRQPVSPVQP
jgi:hypothetical protein